MRAVIRGFRKDSEGEYEIQSFFNLQRSELVPILEGVKDALLSKAEKITLTIKYNKANEFEIRKELIIKDFGK